MSQSVTALKIGSKVRVDLDKVRDRIPTKLIEQIKGNPRGIVKAYKMTDGGGVGVVIQLSNGETSWFFNEELKRN